MEVNTRYTMPLKAVQLVQYTLLTEVGTSGLAGIQSNTSMAEFSD